MVAHCIHIKTMNHLTTNHVMYIVLLNNITMQLCNLISLLYKHSRCVCISDIHGWGDKRPQQCQVMINTYAHIWIHFSISFQLTNHLWSINLLINLQTRKKLNTNTYKEIHKSLYMHFYMSIIFESPEFYICRWQFRVDF